MAKYNPRGIYIEMYRKFYNIPSQSMYVYIYRIQTDARVITGNTTEIKNRGRRPRFFISRLDFP